MLYHRGFAACTAHPRAHHDRPTVRMIAREGRHVQSVGWWVLLRGPQVCLCPGLCAISEGCTIGMSLEAGALGR